MAVAVACSCGKQLRIPDEYRGKRIKCPGCGEGLGVPATSKPKADDLIRFECECGAPLQAKSENAGKMTRCPECGEKQEIPEQLEEVEASQPKKTRIQNEPPPSRKKAAAVVEDEEDEDDSP